MGLILLVPGLILLLVQASWFEGQHTVGLVLTVVGAVLLAIQAIWTVVVGRQALKIHRDVRDSFDSRRRGSRSF